MSKPSSSKLFFFQYLHHHHPKPISPPNSATSSSPISQILSSNPNLNPRIPSSPTPHLSPTSISKLPQNPHLKIPINPDLSQKFIVFRYISTWGLNLGGKVVNLNLIKGKIKELVKADLVLSGGDDVFVCVLIWRIMFGIANTFIGLSEDITKYGFLALSSAIVAYDMKLLSVDIQMAAAK